jgi:MFS family permease
MISLMSDRERTRRNFLFNVIEGGTYISSNGFIAVQTVLPAVVARLGGSNIEVGAVTVIGFSFLFLPQIFAARYAEAAPWKKPGTILFGFLQRCVMLVMGGVLFLLGRKSPSAALAALLVLYALNQTFSGLTTPFWFDLIAKVTPAHWRGRLVGFRTSMGGAGALVASLVLTLLLASISFPENYALAFVLAALLQLASVVIQSRIIENGPSDVGERTPLKEYFHSLPAIARRRKGFVVFIGAMGLLILGSMPVAFFPVYAVRTLRAGGWMIGEYTTTMVFVQIGSAVLNGLIADRYGNKRSLMIAGSGLALASVTALLVPTAGAFRLVYVFLGVNVGSEVMSRYNLTVDFSPERIRSTFVGLVNTVLAPLYAVGLLGGWISDLLGYRAVFVIGFLCATAGVALLALGVEDPRRSVPGHGIPAAA